MTEPITFSPHEQNLLSPYTGTTKVAVACYLLSNRDTNGTSRVSESQLQHEIERSDQEGLSEYISEFEATSGIELAHVKAVVLSSELIAPQRDLLATYQETEQRVALLAAFVMFPGDEYPWRQVARDIAQGVAADVLQRIQCPNIDAIRQALNGYDLLGATDEDYKTWFDALKEQAKQTPEQALVSAQLEDKEKKSLLDQLSTIDRKTLFLTELATNAETTPQAVYEIVKECPDDEVARLIPVAVDGLRLSADGLRKAVQAVSTVDTKSKSWEYIHIITVVVLAALGLAVGGVLYRNRDSIERARRNWLS